MKLLPWQCLMCMEDGYLRGARKRWRAILLATVKEGIPADELLMPIPCPKCGRPVPVL